MRLRRKNRQPRQEAAGPMAEFEQFIIREKTNAGLAPINIPHGKSDCLYFINKFNEL